MLPDQAAACATRSPKPTPRPSPSVTKLAWRAEETSDGAVRMTVGDVAAAPRTPGARRRADFRHPWNPNDCDDVRIVRVKGWWCTTTVDKIVESGEIVVGGGTPRARIHGAGFSTRCSGRPHRMRQRYQVQRDSWNGMRPYTHLQETHWTADQNQTGQPISVGCPRGRVGTYTYRLAVATEIDDDHLPAGGTADDSSVGDSPATSPVIRTSCGTGVS
ncbi:hypothetical protein GCM10029978_078570 [Actinoallomurus acanthiterrae]